MHDGNPNREQALLGLSRLLQDLVLDSWVMGMNAGVDNGGGNMEALPRYEFIDIVDDLIAKNGGCGVGVLSVRVQGWNAIGREYGPRKQDIVTAQLTRALLSILQPGDVLGRTSMDTYSVFLKHCPPEALEAIAWRFATMIGNLRDLVKLLHASIGVAAWDGEDAEGMIAASCRGLEAHALEDSVHETHD